MRNHNFISIGELYERCIDGMASGRLCSCWSSGDSRGDSVLEQRFWHMMRKTPRAWHGSVDQFQIGRYRVDSIFDCDGKAVVVELDGKAYHDPQADYYRDTEILKSVDAVIRVPFAAMWHFRYGTHKAMETWFPRFENYEILTLTKQQFDEEYAEVCNSGDYDSEAWLNDVEPSYDVVDVIGDMARVGSPKAFLQGWNLTPITLRRGTAAPGILDEVYKKAGCSRTAAMPPMNWDN